MNTFNLNKINFYKFLKLFLTTFTSLLAVSIGFWFVDIFKFYKYFFNFPVSLLLIISLIFSVNILFSTYRLKLILNFFKKYIPYVALLKAVTKGFFVSIFITSLIGQIIGRQLILKNYNVTPIINSSITAFEKILLFIVIGFLALTSSILFLDNKEITENLNINFFVSLFLIILTVFTINKFFSRTNFEKKFYFNILSIDNFKRVFSIILLILLTQILTVSTFVICISKLQYNVDILQLIYASIIISFLSSLPISVNGWGIRELSSIYFFGKIGIPIEISLTVSVVIGICSTITILLFYFFFNIYIKKSSETHQILKNNPISSKLNFDIEKSFAYIITIFSGILIFFQIHLNIFDNLININLSDPLAIIALCYIGLNLAFNKSFPNWRVPYFNVILILITILFSLAYINSYINIGFYKWSFVTRFFGWFILIGYLSIGVIIANYLKKLGRVRFYETIIVTSTSILIIHIFLRVLNYLFNIDPNIFLNRFEGYSANPNAFSFQLIFCLMSLIFFTNYKNKIGNFDELNKSNFLKSENFYIILQAICIFGLILSGSRTAWGAIIIFLVFSHLFNLVNFKYSLKLLIFTFIIYFSIIWAIPKLLIFLNISISEPLSKLGDAPFSYVYLNVHSPVSDSLRLDTIIRGLELWWNNPIFGSGLGVFHYYSSMENLETVIHSTPIWMLVELGLIGFLLMIIAVFWVIYFLIAKKLKNIQYKMILFTLIIFLIFSTVHEMFFQRIFWLYLGVSLALPDKKNLILN